MRLRLILRNADPKGFDFCHVGFVMSVLQWRCGGNGLARASTHAIDERWWMGKAPRQARAMEQHMKKIIGSILAIVAMATAAEAHVSPLGHMHGFVEGFTHPMTGLDHVLAMVAVGVFAATIGGRALWAVPLSFVAAMIAGGVWRWPSDG
jgi:hypothetical protein